MRILVTGSDGLIGKRICEKLIEQKHIVLKIDKDINNKIENCDPKLIGEIDMIIHCAANCIIRNIIQMPYLAFENALSTFACFDIAKATGCKKIIYFSSSRVQHKEENPYTASKKLGENLAEAYKQCYGIDYLIIRPETVWALDDKHNRVIPTWIKNAQENKDIIIYGDKEKTLPPIHVKSFTEEFMKIFDKFINNKLEKRIWSISGKSIKATDIINNIIDFTKSKSKIIYKDSETTQPQNNYKSDIIDKLSFKEDLKRELQ